MNLKSTTYRLISIFVLAFCFYQSNGQQSPFNPVTYYVFNPAFYNPAITGSKDFFSLGMNAAFYGNSNSQIISADTRIYKKTPGYFSSPQTLEFTNFGAGGSVFRNAYNYSMNTGVSLSGSWQIPMSQDRLTFLSIGISGKASIIKPDSNGLEPVRPVSKILARNIDAGVYFYSPSFYTGFAVIYLPDYTALNDSSGALKKKYFFNIGSKFLLVRKWNMVLEPSVIYYAQDSILSDISDKIIPVVKLYVQNFSVGTSFRNDGKIAFFSQYKYPKFYVGIFYELAKKTAYYKNSPLVEFTFGLNLQKDRIRFSDHSHW